MNDDFWKYGFPALTALLAVGFTKLLEVVAQRRKTVGRLELDTDEFTWRQARDLMGQYKADIKELRVELVEVRATAVGLAQQVVERDRRIDALEIQISTLQAQMAMLQSQNHEANMLISRLNDELDMLKGDAK